MSAYYNEIDPYAAQWGGGIVEYWWSAFPPVGVPQRTWYEPIDDEL